MQLKKLAAAFAALSVAALASCADGAADDTNLALLASLSSAVNETGGALDANSTLLSPDQLTLATIGSLGARLGQEIRNQANLAGATAPPGPPPAFAPTVGFSADGLSPTGNERYAYSGIVQGWAFTKQEVTEHYSLQLPENCPVTVVTGNFVEPGGEASVAGGQLNWLSLTYGSSVTYESTANYTLQGFHFNYIDDYSLYSAYAGTGVNPLSYPGPAEDCAAHQFFHNSRADNTHLPVVDSGTLSLTYNESTTYIYGMSSGTQMQDYIVEASSADLVVDGAPLAFDILYTYSVSSTVSPPWVVGGSFSYSLTVTAVGTLNGVPVDESWSLNL